MMFDDVKPGDPIPRLASFWNGLKAAVQVRRLLPGVGVRLREMPFGTIINFDADATAWDHPWRVTLTGKEATLRRGLVDGIEPKINGRLMSGDDKNPDPPKLSIAPSRFDSSGRSLICVEVECDKGWNTKAASILQISWLDETDGSVATSDKPIFSPNLPNRRTRFALAQLRKDKNGGVTVFPIAYFNLRHLAIGPSDSRIRHFFFPD